MRVDLAALRGQAGEGDAVEVPKPKNEGGALEAVREWFGQLTDIALEYPYPELAAATGNFSKEKCLGAGGAGAVYRGKLRGGTEVAVKALQDLGGLEGFEDEVRVLSKFRHPNLVTLYGWGQHKKTKYIVYELLPGGDLQGRLRPKKEGDAPFGWQERLRVAWGAANGLSHMMNNQPKCFHRDIKPPNILIDADGTAKMADFGLAAVLQNSSSENLDDIHIAVDQVSGTPGYMCPTYMQSGRVTEQSEAFSFGIVLLELLLNKPPCLCAPGGDLIYPLMEALRPAAPGAHARALTLLDHSAGWSGDLADDFADLALACVDLVPSRRPAFKVILGTLTTLNRLSNGQEPPAEIPRKSSPAVLLSPTGGAKAAFPATEASQDGASTSDGEFRGNDSDAASDEEVGEVDSAMPETGHRSRSWRWWS